MKLPSEESLRETDPFGENSGNPAKKTRAKRVKSSMARSLPVENLLPQNVGSIINCLQ